MSEVSRRGFLGGLLAFAAAPLAKQALPLGEWQVVEVPPVNFATGLDELTAALKRCYPASDFAALARRLRATRRYYEGRQWLPEGGRHVAPHADVPRRRQPLRPPPPPSRDPPPPPSHPHSAAAPGPAPPPPRLTQFA